MNCEACSKIIGDTDGLRVDREGYTYHEACFSEGFALEGAAQKNEEKPSYSAKHTQPAIALCQQGQSAAKKNGHVWYEHLFQHIEAAVLAQQQAGA